MRICSSKLKWNLINDPAEIISSYGINSAISRILFVRYNLRCSQTYLINPTGTKQFAIQKFKFSINKDASIWKGYGSVEER